MINNSLRHKKRKNSIKNFSSSSGNDRYLKQLSKLLEVVAEISENNEKNNSNCKSGGAEDQIINDNAIFFHPDNENNTH